MDKRAKILIVDDEPFSIDYLEQELEELDCETTSAQNGREALEQVTADAPDVILLDIMMPEMDGFQMLTYLKANKKLRDIPVIIISVLDDIDNIVRGIKMGAEDYLPKPFDPVLLKARIGACLEKKWLRDREALYLQQINQELALAWQIQAGFLPDDLPDFPGWQLAATLKPSRQTSGDFYDLIPLPNGRLGILVADVADKGMGAALFMVLSRTLIRTYAVQYHTQPDSVFRAVNQRILMDIDTNQFVTAFYGILDPVTGTLTYCNAGHSPPYLLSAQGGDAIQSLRRTGMPLGIFEDTNWEQRAVQVAPGDMLILYSDGLTEAWDRQQEELFGKERLLEVAQANLGRSAQDVQDALMTQVLEFMGDAPQSDDITLAIVVRDSSQALTQQTGG
jgi:sigma-B regulation protein RsbU (phosphoserine phosphatase)